MTFKFNGREYGGYRTTAEYYRQLFGTENGSPTEQKPKNKMLEGLAQQQFEEEVDLYHELMPRTNKYARGVHALRQTCLKENNQLHPRTESGLYRPLTFKENIEARVNSYETEGSDKLRLFNRWLESCCGIAYKGGTSKFKITPICEELITIDKDFDGRGLPINYDSLQGVELDSGKAKYGQLLTKNEVLDHPAWLAAVEGDRALLKAYSDIVFSERRRNKAMGFWVLNNPSQDQRRALFVNSIGNGSNACGNDSLGNDGSFLRVAPCRTK